MNQDFDKPIRVLCVFGALDRGGAESMCMNLFRNIDRSKVTFDFVKHTSKKGDFEQEITELGGMIYTCPALTIHNYYKYIKWWEAHFKAHPEHMIIHGHMFTTSGLYFKVAHRYGRKTIAHSHCSKENKVDERSFIEQYIRKRLRDMIPHYSDYQLACSTSAGNLIFPDGNFTVFNNAIDTNSYRFNMIKRKEIRHEFNIPERCRLLVVVGRIIPPKNPYGVLEICREIAKQTTEWRLIWCGSGPMMDEIQRAVKEKGLDKYIIFAGVRRDIDKVLQAADVFIMPSIFEGLPVAAVEAQAAGLPCFISDRVAMETDITGLCHFLPIESPENWAYLWAEAILKDQTERQDTSTIIIDAGYDIQTTAKWIENFYLGIAGQTQKSER